MSRTFLVVLAALFISPASASAGEWIAGDLHVHTTYSHDVYGGPGDDNTGPEDLNTLGFPVQGSFGIAAQRGMGFLGISDHNDVRSATDPSFGAFGVTGLPGYENSLAGHAQMIGATRIYPKVDGRSAEQVQRLADDLRADGGVFQVNHPADSTTSDPDDLDWALEYAVRPDTVEAWNGPGFYQPPFPSSNSHDEAIRYWEGWLDRGAKVGLTGGSDSHWAATAAGQGPGQPTTWVYAADRSRGAVLEGIRAGRTMISHQPPALGGARLFLEADNDRNGSYESMVGDTVRPGARLRVRGENAAGMRLRIVMDEGKDALPRTTILEPTFAKRFKAPKSATWVRAELGGEDAQEVRQANCPREEFGSYCRNRILTVAMTSALYLRATKK